jgi:sugar transferase (PEP-CTERM system associated)
MSVRIFRHYVQLPIVVLMVVEALAAIAVLYVTRLALESAADRADAHWFEMILFAGVLLLCFAALGLYNVRLRELPAGIALRMVVATVAALLALFALGWLLPAYDCEPEIYLIAAVGTLLMAFLFRVLYRRIVQEEFFKRRTLVYGAGRHAHSIASLRRRTDRIGFQIVGYVRTPGDAMIVPADKIVHLGTDLLRWCQSNDVDEIVVAMDDRRRAFPVHDLLQCRLHGIECLELVTFLERETGRVRLDVLNPSWMIFSEGFHRSFLREAAARSLDVAASAALLAVAWPLMLLATLAIMVEDGPKAPVLYRQRRVGQGGRVFNVLKFRSMRIDAEHNGAQWAVKGDSRVTRVGALIRKMRIDELPQLFNVFIGDMRFVGPRPERPEFVRGLEDRLPYYAERHSVKPGLTGWAQMCYPYGSSEQDALQKLQYDLYYIKNRTLVFDLAILVQTVEVVLFGKGAH